MTASFIEDLGAFIQASPSSFHAAAEVARRLREAGYVEQREDADWSAQPGGHYVLRDGAIIAWRIPEDGGSCGFRVVGTHTDSPGFKLKPQPSTRVAGWAQAGMEVYGGPLLNSWLDREFGLAGRLMLRDGSQVLVETPAWLRIPQLAPHLDRSVNESLHLDRQQHLMPVYGVGEETSGIVDLVATTAGVAPHDVVAHELFAAILEPGAVFGTRGEFFAAPRLDNLVSVHAGLRALLTAGEVDCIPVLACFDHEEVGSVSRTGAAGPFLDQVLRRISAALGDGEDAWFQRLARSCVLSADAGHAVHPNYAGLHDPQHRSVLNCGPLLKVNANQRYATDGPAAAAWARACEGAGVPSQTFVSNNAVPCGSTIGPATAARLGVTTCDVGVPMLSMHSTREMVGVLDPSWFASALTVFLAQE